MIYILIGLIFATVCVGLMNWRADKNLGGGIGMAFIGFTSMLLGLLTVVAWFAFAFMSAGWFSAKYKTDIINREYGTSYKTEEIFWASSVIDIIRELDRRRYEVNGDFRREQADSKEDRDSRSHGTDQRK